MRKSNKEQVRDGFLGDLPDDLQLKIMNIHKLIKKAIDDLLNNSNYSDLKQSSWAMSCIDEFGVMPKDKNAIGSVRVYKKGKTYRCMIQATGHFRNHQYGWIEELLHEFICNVYATIRPEIRKKYDMTITNEGRTGQPYEGFDIYPNPKTVPGLWEKFEDRKTKVITESEEVECSDDLIEYYEMYHNMSYDQFFLERSHGLLNFSFRLGFNVENGHKIKIVFDLKPDDVEIFGRSTKTSVAKQITRPDQIINSHTGKMGPNMSKFLAQIDDSNRQNIKKLGDVDFASRSIIKAIIDLDTKEKLHSVNATGIYMGKAGQTPNIDEFDKLGKNRKFFPNNFDSLDLIEREKIATSIGKDVSSCKYVVGETESDVTFKTTSGYTYNAGKLLSDAVHQSNIRTNSIDIDPRTGGFNKPRQIDQHLHASNKKIIESTTNVPEYNVDMTEVEAKRTLRTLSQGIINDTSKKKDYKVTQYTANIYANIITKNLLPLWAKGFRKFSITLDNYQSFPTFEFKVPTMTQDFVSRFVAGRESINGFIHRQSEIKIKMSPRIFHTMKNPDDAFTFFKSAIRYYDGALERYSDKLMVEIMKLNREMKHLISTTKMSGIVTYPMNLLFIFDKVTMDNKDTFKISQEDIKTINNFIHNIYTKYAAPDKEKKQVVDDIREMVKALHESCDRSDPNISQMIYLEEAVSNYLFGGFANEIKNCNDRFIYENMDHEWNNNQKNHDVIVLQEAFGVKKLKKIPTDLIAYITIEGEAIKDSNDKMMISSYCLGKIEIVEWYIELLETGSNKYIVPHSKPYLEGVRTQLLACFKKIMDTQIPKKDRPMFDIKYPTGYEG